MNPSKQRFLGTGRFRVTPPKLSTLWLLVADRSKARIFQKTGKTFQPVEEFICPDGKLHTSDIVTDKAGREYSSNSRKSGRPSNHAYDTDHTMRDHVGEKFAGDLAAFLATAQSKGLFDSMIVVADPHFLGLLRQHLNESTAQKVRQYHRKDFAWMDDQEVTKRLQKLTG